MFTSVTSPTRSNTATVFGAFAVMFGLLIYAQHLEPVDPRLAYSLAVATFSFVFLALGSAQIRSGYLWRNLSPGNRGQHRNEAPARFALSTAFHFLLGGGIIAYAVWAYFHPSFVPHAP